MITLTENQEELIRTILKWYNSWYNSIRRGEHPQWFAYSGAAGTGKTTVIKEVLNALGLSREEYVGCAYVGKAVLQLQKHGLNAMTIHSLIYDITFGFEKDSKTGKKKMSLQTSLKDNLEYEYKLIIVDEATMVNDSMVEELLSFGIPIIFLGDMNQLPPIFGISSVMIQPNFRLTQIMRQAEDDPIVQYSQMVLNYEPLPLGVWGKSKVLEFNEFNDRELLIYDQILTTTNKDRYTLNKFIREDLNKIRGSKPVLGDRVICRRNNWGETKDGYALTNGLTGVITDIGRESLYKGAYKIDFHPDFFADGVDFENLLIDAKHIIKDVPSQSSMFSDFEIFEYAYAITVHLSQGSEYDNVLFFDKWFFDEEMTRKARYTAITRAKESITIVNPEKKKRWY